MNVPQIALSPNTASPEPGRAHDTKGTSDARRSPSAKRATEQRRPPDAKRASEAHERESFEVPEEPSEKPLRESGSRDEAVDLDDDARRAAAPEAPRAEDIAAWMLSAFMQIAPPAPAQHVDITSPDATLDTPSAPSPDHEASRGADLGPERSMKSAAQTSPERPLEGDATDNDLNADAPAIDASAKEHTPARESPPAARATTAQIDPSKVSATLAAKAHESARGDDLARPGASAARQETASSELASASLSAPGSPWAASLATPSARLTDSGLTAVNGPTQAPAAENDPLRARLMSAQTSAINQRAIENAAHGEVVIPELGRVTVSARSEREAVTVEVRAAQAATAHALHAHANAIAADVRAADIPLTSLSFEGAGTWTSADARGSSRDGARDHDTHGDERDDVVTPTREATRARSSGRVRIVL